MPSRNTTASSASAMIEADSTVRNTVARLWASFQISDRAAIRLQCSVPSSWAACGPSGWSLVTPAAGVAAPSAVSGAFDEGVAFRVWSVVPIVGLLEVADDGRAGTAGAFRLPTLRTRRDDGPPLRCGVHGPARLGAPAGRAVGAGRPHAAGRKLPRVARTRWRRRREAATNGARALVETAAAGGVDTWFANPGTTELSLVAALDEVPSARAILGLFEGVCTGAADGYARMAGRPAATLLHLGPGLGNGLANLHNARRAGSGMLNVVGDHPTWHRAADAPLTTDVPMLASPMSDWVRTAGSAATLAGDAAEALAVAGAGGVATLVVPADCQWSPAPGGPLVPPAAPPRSAGDAAPTVAAALRGAERAVLLLGGSALSERGLRAAERVAAASGCRLLVETFPARLERGGGLPSPPRLAYFPDQAAAALADAGPLVLAGARDPVPFFGYPDGRRKLTAPGTQVLSAAAPTEDAERALEELADLAGAPPRAPAAGQAGAPPPAAADHAGGPPPAAPAPARAGSRPELPTGRLTVE